MEFQNIAALFISVNVVLVYCESAYVDTLNKCSKSDNKCHANLIKTILSENAFPDMGLEPIDPFKINGMHIEVLDLINITIVEGIVKGVKNCNVQKFIANFDTGHATITLLCDLTIEGLYKASSSSPVVKSFVGAESVHGEGNGKVKIVKLKISVDFTFKVIKRDNDLYIKCKFDKTKYTYDILGKVQFFADKIYLGKEESSVTVIKLMNENWRLIINAIGKKIMDIAMDIVFGFISKFFSSVPLNKYIKEDLSSYVVN